MENKMSHHAEGSTPDSDSDGMDMDRKRRPSRSSRTVSNLSKEQLERKRTNDREAQRAIRKRTKEQMANMQQWIAHLTAPGQPGERIAELLMQIEELKRQNAELHRKIELMRRGEGDADAPPYAVAVPRPGGWDSSTVPRASPTADVTYQTRDVGQEASVSPQNYRPWSNSTAYTSGQVKLEETAVRSPPDYSNWSLDPQRMPRLEQSFQRSDQAYPLQRPGSLLATDQYNRVYPSAPYGHGQQSFPTTGSQYPVTTSQMSQSLPQPSVHHIPQRTAQATDQPVYYAPYQSQPTME